LQEILYRALEREPKNRYASAREFAHDLEHQDQVGVRQSPGARRLLVYGALAMVPVVIFLLLYLVSRRR
jgi:hypothetical protein